MNEVYIMWSAILCFLSILCSSMGVIASNAQCFSCAQAPPGTVWCDDFEDGKKLEDKYFEYDSDEQDCRVDKNIGRDNSQGLRIVWQKDELSAGGLKKSIGKTPSAYIGKNAAYPDSVFTEIYWHMDVRHQKGWKGNGPAKLSRALCLANNSWSTGMMAHLWSGGEDNTYLGMDPASGISTDGKLQTTRYNDFPNLRWLGFKSGSTPLFSDNNSDTWYCVEGHVKLNTPGKNDGIFEFWINDTLQAQSSALNWHGTWNSDPKAMAINAVFFENYWNDASPVQQERYFDNLVISTQRIGCECQSISEAAIPALPVTDSVITCFPDTSGYRTITVGAMGRDYTDLQKAIDNAELGSIIRIDAGMTLRGSYILRNKKNGKGWIIITTSHQELLPHQRIDPQGVTNNKDYPTQASVMPKIITVNPAGVPCFTTEPQSHHYRLVGLEITADTTVKESYGLVNLGDVSQKQNSLQSMPHHYIVDRCYIHGHSKGTIMKYGVGLHCANAAIIDSYISDFHSIGFDAQAISGINGTGPFKIINNYLEASGENIMFGGAAPAIAGLVPSDIEIRNNYLYKPLRWRTTSPLYEGKHWTIKNLFELKTGRRVLLEGNILENSWADLPIGQSGYAILLTVRTENGKAMQADVSDITIQHNIIKNCGAGITLSGKDDNSQGNQSKRILIQSNIFENINGAEFGDNNINGPNDGTFIKMGEPQDVIIRYNTILQSGPVTWVTKPVKGFTFTDNTVQSYKTKAGYQGIYGPGYVQGNATIAHYFPDITDASKRIHRNVFIGGDSLRYISVISQNYFPKERAMVGFSDGIFTDYRKYTLSAQSPYSKGSTEGKNIGADINAIDSALKFTIICPSAGSIAVSGFTILQDSVTINRDDTLSLTGIITPINADNKNIVWKSGDNNVVTIDNNGMITALSAGSTFVSGTTLDGGYRDSCFVRVRIPSSITESEAELLDTIIVHNDILYIPDCLIGAKISIVDILGHYHSIDVMTNSVSIASLPSGVYSAFFSCHHNIQMYRFVKM